MRNRRGIVFLRNVKLKNITQFSVKRNRKEFKTAMKDQFLKCHLSEYLINVLELRDPRLGSRSPNRILDCLPFVKRC